MTFLNMPPKAQIENMNKQMGPYQTKKLQYSKENNKTKSLYNRRKVLANCILYLWRILYLFIYSQIFKALNNSVTRKRLIWKIGKNWIAISQKKIYRWPLSIWKKNYSLCSLSGKCKSKHNEISRHTSEWLWSRDNKIDQKRKHFTHLLEL